MLTSYIIETIGFTRKNFLELTSACTPEEWNAIPRGFANNLIWNLGHMVATQQNLCYGLSGVTPRVDESFINAYKATTAPGDPLSQTEIDHIRAIAVTAVAQLNEDYNAGIFTTYTQRQTKYGVLITNIDEAISYDSSHEGLHFGYAKAMLRLLRC